MKQIVIQEDTIWYSVKDMCDICNVSKNSWDRFNREFLSITDDTQKDIKERPSRIGGNLYSESILKQFQMWLMRNQANQGKSSDVVKAAATTALNTGISLQVIIASGNEEAFNEYVGMAREAFNTQRNLKLEQQKNQQLQLEVDKYVQWLSASQIKKEYHLPAKPGITKVAQLLGLKRNEDWIEKGYGDDTCFTKILYSPSAVKLIVDWHFDED